MLYMRSAEVQPGEKAETKSFERLNRYGCPVAARSDWRNVMGGVETVREPTEWSATVLGRLCLIQNF